VKKICVLVAATLAVSCGYAQTHAKPAKTHQQASSTPATAAPKATGPTGFGAIRLGMTQSAIEALQASDGTYLAGPLEPDTSTVTLPPDAVKVKGELVTPLGSEPGKVSLTFTSGLLTAMSVTLAEGQFAQAKSQLIEKYGEGKLDDDRKDEQCLYGNGSNFKVNSGAVAHRWVQSMSANDQIKGAAIEYTIDMCPPSLRSPYVGPTTVRFIVLSLAHPDSNAKAANLF
jgi:hypothetical protein